MSKIRIGICGASRIAKKFIDACKYVDSVSVVGVAARDISRARAFMEEQNLDKCYGSYEEMANDKDIDLVYVCTHHPYHKAASMIFLKAKKHVICEKPIAITACDFEEMVVIARENNVLLLEALWTMYLPATLKVKELIDAKEIGNVKLLSTIFGTNFAYSTGDRHKRNDLAGGAVLDLGVYTMSIATKLLGEDIVSIKSDGVISPDNVDEINNIMLRFKSGAVASIVNATTFVAPKEVVIYGDKGTIKLFDFTNLNEFSVYKYDTNKTEVFSYPHKGGNGFVSEIEEAVSLINAGKIESQIHPFKRSRFILTTLENLYSSWNLKFDIK